MCEVGYAFGSVGPAPALPSVTFSADAYSVVESAGTATVTVQLSAAATTPVTVDYATSAGTATAGDDYTQTSGTLTFAPGSTSQTFTVPVVDDTTVEFRGKSLRIDLHCHYANVEVAARLADRNPGQYEPSIKYANALTRDEAGRIVLKGKEDVTLTAGSTVKADGKSGGGGKVSTMMAMPSAKGLFHRAAVQSGSTRVLAAMRRRYTPDRFSVSGVLQAMNNSEHLLIGEAEIKRPRSASGNGPSWLPGGTAPVDVAMHDGQAVLLHQPSDNFMLLCRRLDAGQQ